MKVFLDVLWADIFIPSKWEYKGKKRKENEEHVRRTRGKDGNEINLQTSWQEKTNQNPGRIFAPALSVN